MIIIDAFQKEKNVKTFYDETHRIYKTTKFTIVQVQYLKSANEKQKTCNQQFWF